MKYLLLLSLLINPWFTWGVEAHDQPQQQFPVSEATQHPDRQISTAKIVGYVDEFMAGDYSYVRIKTARGRQYQFMLDGDEGCFLAKYKRAKLWIEYREIERYIEQAGGYEPVKIIKTIRTAKTTWAKWQKSATPAELQQCRENWPPS
jgi:hypothetical protein